MAKHCFDFSSDPLSSINFDETQYLALPDIELVYDDNFALFGLNLSPGMLLSAYQQGYFPWPVQKKLNTMTWFSLGPRMVLIPKNLHLGSTFKKILKKAPYRVSMNQNFEQVIEYCSADFVRKNSGSWISQDIINAYTKLHSLGFAHSVEVWENNVLIGGLYGIAIGKVFFGESMFSLKSGASRYGFTHFVAFLQMQGFKAIDCQQETPYLESLGAQAISKKNYKKYLKHASERVPLNTSSFNDVELNSILLKEYF